MGKEKISYLKANELFKYDCNSGIVTWKVSQGPAIAGSRAGHLRKDGYRSILIFRKQYQEHRLAWLLIYGVYPNVQVDHINGIKSDNRISNLREATASENRQNLTKVVSKTGLLGVTFNKACNKWQAAIKLNGVSKYLGLYEDAESASDAYKKAKSEFHLFQPTIRGAA